MAKDTNIPLIGQESTAHHFHRGSFSSAIQPQKACDFAFAKFKIKMIHHALPRVLFG